MVDCQCQRAFPWRTICNKNGLAMVLLGQCSHRRHCFGPYHTFPQSPHSGNSVLGRYQGHRLAGMSHSSRRHRTIATRHRVRRCNIPLGFWAGHHLDHRWNCHLDRLFPCRSQGRKISSRPDPAVQKLLESLYPCNRLLSRIRVHRRILFLTRLLPGGLGRQCFALRRLSVPFRSVTIIYLHRDWLHHQEDRCIPAFNHWGHDVSHAWLCALHRFA